jgi:hypothetical protein
MDLHRLCVSCVGLSALGLLACTGDPPGTADDDSGGGHTDAAPGDTSDAATPPPSDAPDANIPAACGDDPAPARPAGLPDWSHAGYRGGLPLPDASKILATIDVAAEHGVIADDGLDDSAGLQAAIEHAGSITGRDFDHLVVL